MSIQNVRDYPKSLTIRLGKTAALFLFISIIAFLLVKIVGPILQTSPELVVESLISGVPLLIAIGCAIAAIIAKIVKSLHHAAA